MKDLLRPSARLFRPSARLFRPSARLFRPSARLLLPLLAALLLPAAGHGRIREIASGESPLPPATGTNKKTAEALIEAFSKDRDAALLACDGKPIHIVGQVKDFTGDYPLNHERDFFVIVGPAQSAAQEPPYRIYVRFTRPQMAAFGYPEDRKPKIADSRYEEAKRVVNQSYTVAYFNKDLNCIALYDSETLIVPPTNKKVPYVVDKIPLVAVGDPFEADVVFEQVDANNTVIFDATINPEQFRHPLPPIGDKP